MHFGELELQSSILASSPPLESGIETATPQSHQRHMAAIHKIYDALCVAPINTFTSHLHNVYYWLCGWRALISGYLALQSKR